MALGASRWGMTVVRALCEHQNCAQVTPEEIRAAQAVGALLGFPALDRICEQSTRGPKPDFRGSDRATRLAVEVKRLTSGTMQRHNADRSKYLGGDSFHPVPSLRLTWLVFIDTTAARDTFAAGGASPKLDRLVYDLSVELERIESAGCTDGGRDSRIRRLTHSSTCSAVPNSPAGPGIIISESHGSARSTDIETDVVAFLASWLASDYSKNLRASLGAEGGQRVAALVADSYGPAEGMIRTLSENATCPVTPLALPPEIDTLVVIAAQHVLDFETRRGWRRRAFSFLPT